MSISSNLKRNLKTSQLLNEIYRRISRRSFNKLNKFFVSYRFVFFVVVVVVVLPMIMMNNSNEIKSLFMVFITCNS